MSTAADPALPDFMADHVLVAFHRDSTESERRAAYNALSETEIEATDRLDQLNDSGGDYRTDDVVVVHAPEQADGVTSIAGYDPETGTASHRPVIDLDLNAALIPSATPGHFHLYLDKVLEHDDYMYLLNALAEVGIIESGYNTASQERGYSSARLPSKPKVVAS